MKPGIPAKILIQSIIWILKAKYTVLTVTFLKFPSVLTMLPYKTVPMRSAQTAVQKSN